jgi:hypothetical protein
LLEKLIAGTTFGEKVVKPNQLIVRQCAFAILGQPGRRALLVKIR